MAKPPATFTIEKFTASDGYGWHYRYYAPPSGSPPLGQFVFLHGIQSHGGWYEHSASRLSQAGYAVYFLDRRGSGLNNADRGDTPSYQRLIDDVVEFAAQLPSLPSFLAAISWGGKVATAVQSQKPGRFQGLVRACLVFSKSAGLRDANGCELPVCGSYNRHGSLRFHWTTPSCSRPHRTGSSFSVAIP